MGIGSAANEGLCRNCIRDNRKAGNAGKAPTWKTVLGCFLLLLLLAGAIVLMLKGK